MNEMSLNTRIYRINVALAEKVMGYEYIDDSESDLYGCWIRGDGFAGDFDPMRDVADAWQIVEKLEDHDPVIMQYRDGSPRGWSWYCDFEGNSGIGDTIQEAICAAALKFKQIVVE